jgi:hypothetical protein
MIFAYSIFGRMIDLYIFDIVGAVGLGIECWICLANCIVSEAIV